MPAQTYELGNELVHLHTLPLDFDLDVTSARYTLKDGQASKVIGLDVLAPGRTNPINRRKPVGVSIPEADRPVTTVEALSVQSLAVKRYMGVLHSTFAAGATASKTTAAQYRSMWDQDQYDPNNGQYYNNAAANNFNNYNPLLGDRFAIHKPYSIRGHHSISSKIDANTLQLPVNLSSFLVDRGLYDSAIDGFVCTRPGYVFLYPYDNLIPNPTFAGTNGWVLTGNWSISGGNLVHTVSGGAETATMRGVLEIGKTYKIMCRGSASGLSVLCGTNGGTVAIGTALTLVCQGNENFSFSATAGGNSISSVYVIEVKPTELWFVKTPDLYDAEGGWPAEMKDTEIVFNSDRRMAERSAFRIIRIDSYAADNDTLVLDDRGIRLSGFGGTFEDPTYSTPNVYSKFEIIYNHTGSIDGILLSNGRKFWVQREGRIDLVLDLGDDMYLGSRWRLHKIAANRFMLVTPKFAPRILYVDAPTIEDGTLTDESSLAGLPSPQKHSREEFTQDTGTTKTRYEPSWLMDNTTGGGLSAGNFQALVRLIHLEDGVVSDAVPVAAASGLTIDPTVPDADPASLIVAAVANDRISVFPATNSGNESGGSSAPTLCKRATHVEIWGSSSQSQLMSGQTAYYLQARIPLADFEFGCEHQSNKPYTLAAQPAQNYPLQLNDANMSSLPLLSLNDFSAGGLPPICKDVVSLLDVTLCFGKADSVVSQPVVYSRNFYSGTAKEVYSAGDINAGVVTKTNFFTNYDFRAGDLLHIAYSAALASTSNGGTITPGDYEIAEKISNSAIRLKDSSVGTRVTDHSSWHIKRPYTVNYPQIVSDEDVWYSRTDLFGPENFPPRIYTLSRKGDIYRKAIVLGRQIIVIMDQAVHLLRLENVFNTLAPVAIEVGTKGFGTPWADSIVTLGTTLYWATPQGIRSFSLSEEANIDGNKYRTEFLGESKFQSWFQEAWKNNETIDAGADPFNLCLRFRRHKGENQFEVLQYSLRTQTWTMILHDNGLRYVQSRSAGPAQTVSPLLYTVDEQTGAIFEVNNTDYVRTETLSRTPTMKVELDSVKSRTNVWNPDLVGEIIKFKDVHRVVLTADEKKLTFDVLPPAALEESFVIAPRPFLLKLAPFRGRLATLAKTLHSAMLRSLPYGGGEAPDITVKVYEDLSEEPSSEASVGSFFEKTAGKSSDDRVLSIVGQGTTMEMEISAPEDALGAFEIEHAEFELREEVTRL